MSDSNRDAPTLTVGELKNKLALYNDDCLISFSSVGGIEPTFYRFKNWSRDKNDDVTEIILEFNEL